MASELSVGFGGVSIDSPDALQPYQYHPLDPGARSIRVLTLLPGTFTSEIRIALESIHFTDEVIPTFEALSYAWGSSEDPVNILVKDQDVSNG